MTATTVLPLRIQLLGPVRAWYGDQEIDLGTARRRAVFAILALSANHAVSQAELVDGLWGEEPSTKAIGTLHTYIYDLRRALRPVRETTETSPVLTTQGSSYSLRVPRERIDEQLFLRHHETARQQWQRGDFAGAAAELDAALALWHGDSLDGLAGPFAELNRARLGEMRLMARERRAAARLARGEHTATVDELTDLVGSHPLREAPRGLLMVALHRSGRDVAAVRLFEDTERVLVSELGIEPGTAMQRIREKIATGAEITPADIGAGMWTPQDPGRAALVPLFGGDGPKPPPTFVGRTRELDLLRPVLTGLADGHGGCLWIEGVLGMGKTSLLARGLADPPAGCRVVWSTADQLAGHLDGPEPDRDAVDRTVALVARACTHTQLVLVVEDLQRSDDKALLLWHRLARLTLRLPLLLIGLSRPVSPTSELVQLRNAVHAVGGRVLNLDPLPPDTVADLVTRRTGGRCGPALAARLESAGGNPLFAGELLDVMTDAGALRVADGVADLVDLDPTAEAVLESATTALILRRLGFLGPRTHEMVRCAALLGTVFSVADIAAVMRVTAVDLIGAVGEATMSGVLVEHGRELAFRSDAVRQALYHEWPPKVRPLRHIQAARALSAARTPVDRVATQILSAAPALSGWAIRWLRDNIDAVSVQDASIAAELLAHVVASVDVPAASLEELAVRRVRLLFQLGRTPTAEARAVLYRTTDPERVAELRWILAQLEFFAGEVGYAHTLLWEVESSDAPETWKARCQALLAEFEHTMPGGIEVATRTAGAALDRAEHTEDPASVADAQQQQWYLNSMRRDHRAALHHVDRALAVVSDAPELVAIRLCLLDNQAHTLQNLDRLDEATVVVERMRQVARRYRVRTSRPQVAAAVHHYWTGNWDAAVAELASATDDGPGAAHLDRRLRTGLLRCGVTALISAHRGDVETLRSTLLLAEQTQPIANTIDQENSDFLLVARAVDAGMRAGAAAELAEMDPLLDTDYGRMTLRHQWLPRLVRLAAADGDTRRVRDALELCSAEAKAEVLPARADAAWRWCTALVDEDPASLLVTARHYGEVGRPVEKAAILVDCAELLALRGERERARQMFEDAWTIFTELGARFDVTVAENRMRACGVAHRAATPAVPGWHTLSDTERQVASLAAAAIPNSEIAAKLALSRREVQAHLSRTMQKLGTTSRSDLADRLAHAVHESRGASRPPTSPEATMPPSDTSA